MSIDHTSNATHDEDKLATGAGEDTDRNAERTGGRPAGPDNGRAVQRAETRTREEYADAIRAGDPPTRPDSPDAYQNPDGRRSADRTDTEGTEPARAEPRTREEYADAMRGNGPRDDHQESSAPDIESAPDEPAAAPAVTHLHSEFKDRSLDLYTDGTRWAAADTPRPEETVSEKAELPDPLPTGEELVDSADEGASRLDRFRHKLYEEGDDALDSIEKYTNTAHDIFSHPPTSSYESTPTPAPHIYEAQHSAVDPGTMATALFMTGLVIDRAVHWAVGHYDKHAKGR